MNEKPCSVCRRVLPRTSFCKLRSAPSGLQPRCKECSHRYYLKDRKKIILRSRKWTLENPEKSRSSKLNWNRRNPDKKRVANAKWAAENPKRVTELQRSWALAYPERARDKSKRWAKNNPEKVLQRNRQRRAMLLGAPGAGISAQEWKSLVTSFEGRCAYCMSIGSLTVDHVVPLSRNGSDEISNILPVCKSCNSSKNDKQLLDWVDYLEDLGLISLSTCYDDDRK